ncbi:MAG: low molecular weight phosphotyrosine protein phosphatase [Bacteroidetes bacterium]|nr:low molecular weight phosphotyrosine protein phosphatase [Bacteroidota bacterium]
MPLKLLFVCYASICRSPMAAGLMRHNAKIYNLDWEIKAAGVSAEYKDSHPHPSAVKCMRKHGVDITTFSSTLLTREDILKYDIIYAMDGVIYASIYLHTHTPEEKKKIKLMMSEVYPDRDVDIFDPYHGGESGYSYVYEMIDQATDKIIEHYKDKTAL